MNILDDQQRRQQAYYTDTAADYEKLHLGDAEHTFALGLLAGLVRPLGVTSILDVGAGTGRALDYFKLHAAGVRVVGVEPVSELRKVGHRNGLAEDELVDGDGTRLAFGDGSFDVVTAFGVLHHVPQPRKVLAEMVRVARVGVFVSDANNFGQGGRVGRAVKQALDFVGLWPLINWAKTGGKGYTISKEDGLAYSYSVFTDYPFLRRRCERVQVFTTGVNCGPNPYRHAAHAALLALKKVAG